MYTGSVANLPNWFWDCFIQVLAMPRKSYHGTEKLVDSEIRLTKWLKYKFVLFLLSTLGNRNKMTVNNVNEYNLFFKALFIIKRFLQDNFIYIFENKIWHSNQLSSFIMDFYSSDIWPYIALSTIPFLTDWYTL